LAGDAGSPQSIRVDPAAFASVGSATRSAAVALNLPAGDAIGAQRSQALEVYDSATGSHVVRLAFTRASDAGSWAFDVLGEAGEQVSISPAPSISLTTSADQRLQFNTANNSIRVETTAGGSAIDFFAGLVPGDHVNIGGTGGNDGAYRVAGISADGSTLSLDPSTPVLADLATTASTSFLMDAGRATPLRFGPTGQLLSSPTYTVAIDHGGGRTSSFTMDLSGSTQLAGDPTIYATDQDGFAPGTLAKIGFDGNGYLTGTFTNGQNQRLYRLAIADFVNPEGLAPRDGNVYVTGADSGAMTLRGAGESGLGQVSAGTVELSNVDLADQFNRMIMTQNAYNSSATAFRTLDEVIQVARDLKG
jgi:flagellar hook protein FlgE